MELLEELREIIDIHHANSKNLAKIGGFKILMEIMFKCLYPKARRISMVIFGSIVNNDDAM